MTERSRLTLREKRSAGCGSRLATVVWVPLTSNLASADAPGNVLMLAKSTGLPKDVVANVSAISSLWVGRS